MRLSLFSLDHPRLATVMNIFTGVLGLAAIMFLLAVAPRNAVALAHSGAIVTSHTQTIPVASKQNQG
jgi:hypothetical protein